MMIRHCCWAFCVLCLGEERRKLDTKRCQKALETDKGDQMAAMAYGRHGRADVLIPAISGGRSRSRRSGRQVAQVPSRSRRRTSLLSFQMTLVLKPAQRPKTGAAAAHAWRHQHQHVSVRYPSKGRAKLQSNNNHAPRKGPEGGPGFVWRQLCQRSHPRRSNGAPKRRSVWWAQHSEETNKLSDLGVHSAAVHQAHPFHEVIQAN